MGAEQFIGKAEGDTAENAFRAAVEKAQYDYGHRGYSGSIAEKESFVEIELPEGEEAEEYADTLLSDGDDRVDDKWGPAGCLKMEEGKFLFFGWASS